MTRWGPVLCGLGNSLGGHCRIVLCSLMAVSLIGPVQAQQIPNVSLDQLQQMQGQRGATSSQPPAVTARETILEPTAPSTPLAESQLEQILSSRAGVKLQQYGYDQLGVGRAVSLPQAGAMQDNYVLGVGDEIVLTLRGQENSEYRVVVDRDGNASFPKLSPVSAAGRNFGKFRENLINAVRRAYVSTDAFVTVGRLRQISVLVSGEVGSPGVRTMTGLSSVLDAVFVSGGIKKSGSLRNVLVQRGDRTISVDLYSILLGGVQSRNVVLADGDKVIVPALGATVAIAGKVRRPGIFELPVGRGTMDVREAVKMASGTATPGSYAVSLLRTMPDGRRQLIDVTGEANYKLHDGEIIVVKPAVDISINQVTLSGAVRIPGTVALGKYKTLHDILPSTDVLQPGAYVLLGVIERIDPVTQQRVVLPFSPLRVIHGRENATLTSNDVVRILNKRDLLQLLSMSPAGKLQFAGVVGASRDGTVSDNAQSEVAAGAVSSPGLLSSPSTAALGDVVLGASSGKTGQQSVDTLVAKGDVSAKAPIQAEMLAESASLSPSDAAFYSTSLEDYWTSINGAVQNPGAYLIAPGTTLAEALSGIGGLVSDADLQEFEITSTVIDQANGTSTTSRSKHPATKEEFANVVIQTFDRIEFRRVYSDKFSGSVKIEGEVRYPGVYSILRNETLGSVLRRAGGATDVAYPQGAVFLRTSVARAEEVEHKRIMADMRSQMLNFLMRPAQGNSQPPSGESIKAAEMLMAQMEAAKSLGRVPVVADEPMLTRHPELDILLEPGDSITIPRQPSTVLVVGEVLRAGAQRFDNSGSVDDYVDKAGGPTSQADTSRIIVVLPDGSVRRNSSSWLNFGFGANIPAGSTIFVPRELEVYTSRQLLVDSIQIFSQLATSAAALAVLSKQ